MTIPGTITLDEWSEIVKRVPEKDGLREINTDKRPSYYGGSDASVVSPRDYGKMHNLGFDEVNIIKYVTRWRKKNSIVDLDKAIHYLELLRGDALKEQQS